MPSFSKLLSVGTLLASSIIAQAAGTDTESKPAAGKYHLSEKWHADTFLKHIKFFHAEDPTNGYVNYVDQQTAEKNGLFKIQSDGSLYMGVDHTTTLDPNGKGRDSVRIESKMYYDYGLYVADVAHMPGSICGAWPAFWSVGPKWPENGEVDIIEGVNTDSGNEVVLHTSGSCKMAQQDMTGDLTDLECGLDVSPVGCKVKGNNGTSGTPFNKKGGGYYAMERTTDFVKIWYFPRGSEPKSLVNGSPDTSTFGKPMAHMQGACDFGERFTAQKLVFNTDFCGDWAGGIFGEDGQCPMTDPNSFTSCKNFVAKNPEEFKEAYWKINSVQIFAPGRGPHALGGPGHHGGGHSHPSVVSATTKEVAATQSAVSSETTEAPAETTPTPPSTDLIPESAVIPPSTDLPVPAATSAPETTSTPPSTDMIPAETTSAETTSAPPSTDMIPAETTAAEAPANTETSAPASHGPPSKPMTTRRSTVYQTSTTTICTESSTSKAAVMAVQQSSTSVAQDTTSTPTSSVSTSSSASEEEQSPATTSAAAAHGDLVTEYSTVAVSSTICPGGCSSTQSTPVGADAVAASSSPTSAVQHAAQTSSAADTYEVVAAPTIPSSTQEPDTKPTSSSTPDTPPSHAAAVKVSTTFVYPTPAANRGKSSSSPVISSPAASSPAVSSSSLSRMHGAEQDPSSSSPSASGAMFTGAAGRLSGVSTGVIGVVAVVVFFV